MNSIFIKIALGQARHLVGAAGTALASHGYIGDADVQTFVGGAMLVVSMIASALAGEKR